MLDHTGGQIKRLISCGVTVNVIITSVLGSKSGCVNGPDLSRNFLIWFHCPSHSQVLPSLPSTTILKTMICQLIFISSSISDSLREYNIWWHAWKFMVWYYTKRLSLLRSCKSLNQLRPKLIIVTNFHTVSVVFTVYSISCNHLKCSRNYMGVWCLRHCSVFVV